jgi:DNA (cytosine-5-)-methyltransferase
MPATKSILRYPGGKSQLADFVNHLFKINNIENPIYCEPFCGGAGIAFKLLLKGKVKSIILNDYDISVYSIWYAAIFESERFISKILQTDVSLDEWNRQHKIYESLKMRNVYSFDLGFASFFMNRTNHSGILNGGPIGGKLQNSNYTLKCRFNKNTLIKKIKEISNYRDKIALFNLNGIDFIRNVIIANQAYEVFIFFDPPYIGQGDALYKNNLSMTDHLQLAEAIQYLPNPWITTYDTDSHIYQYYYNSKRFRYRLNYSAGIKRNEYEFLFSNPNISIESYGKVNIERITYNGGEMEGI